MITFTLLHKDAGTKARRGRLVTPHGQIETPCFIPVGTKATVKTLTPQDLEELGAQIVLANTYHLMLRPGAEIVEKMGGLGKFMAWSKPTMTDSGGFQVFSMGSAHEKKGKLSKFMTGETAELIERKGQTTRLRPAKIDDEGVTFNSFLDGDKCRLDPKSSIRIQEQLGADLIVAFDDHESPVWDHAKTLFSLERTNRWAIQSLKYHKRKDQLMYGVVHGGIFQDLREESARFTDKHFKAIAIGGSYTSKKMLYQIIDWVTPLISEQKPRHLLGIAGIDDLIEGVERGMDFFDCVAPTRRARHGGLFLYPQSGGVREANFTLQITNSKYKEDKKPIDPDCSCYVCRNFTRSYLHHLYKAKELTALRLGTYHNLHFVTDLMARMRKAIDADQFREFKKQWLGSKIKLESPIQLAKLQE